MKWDKFLDEVAECVGVDKENLQVNGSRRPVIASAESMRRLP
jgi:hypothetical protein